MGIEKRILVLYPMNFYEMSAGTHRRASQVLAYLKERGFSIDLLSIDGYSNAWGSADIGRRELCDRINVVKWEPGKLDLLKLKKAQVTGDLPDFAISPVRRKFKEMLAEKRYDFVIINYVYWASLTEFVPKGTVKVIDLHDFATMYNYQVSGSMVFRLGRMFESEIRGISSFDTALSISEEETLMLGQFCPDTSFVDLPVFFECGRNNFFEKEYDLLFVGSDNPFNKKGLEWFMEEVHPLLSASIRILIVGKAGRFINRAVNTEIIEHAESLDEFYARSKLVFCPLKGGTGLKIKVIEAICKGMPVITTSWGLRGILKKEGNGCVVAEEGHDFAAAVMNLLSDNAQYERLSAQALDFSDRFYSKRVCYEKMDRVFLRTSVDR